MEATRAEAEKVICDCLKDLFARTGVSPKEVDFLVINNFVNTIFMVDMVFNQMGVADVCGQEGLFGVD